MELVFGAKERRWRFTAELLHDNKRWFNAINNRCVCCLCAPTAACVCVAAPLRHGGASVLKHACTA
jgi:hypothetical protein